LNRAPPFVHLCRILERPGPVPGRGWRRLRSFSAPGASAAPWLLPCPALPCPDETAVTPVAALTALFREHGEPLGAQTDNGPVFISHLQAALLSQERVTWLPSPDTTRGCNPKKSALASEE